MLSFLRRLFAPTPAAPESAVQDALASLERRVRAIEAERLELFTEWVKTRDQVLRYMKRAGAIRAALEPAPDDGEEASQGGADEEAIDRHILRLKLGGG